MDRRFMLAMVLSTLVVVVFYTWLIPGPPPKPARTSPAESLAAAGRDTLSGAAPDTASLTAAVPDTMVEPEPDAQTFDVVTPRVAARFTSRGAGVESWALTQFEGKTEQEPVQLVREGVEPSLVVELGGRRHDLSSRIFQAERQTGAGGIEQLVFRTRIAGDVEVVKKFTVRPESPLVELELELHNVPANVIDPAVEVGWTGLPQAEKLPKVDEGSYGAIVSVGEEIERIPAGRFKKERVRRVEGAVHWVGARNKYFFAGVIPPEGVATAAIVSGEAAGHRAGAAVRVPVVSGGDSRHLFRLYLGPLDYWKLKDAGFGLEQAVDLGWKIILPLSQALLWLLVQGYKLIPNYGVVIIIVSALSRILFYPMTRSSMRSMQAMQKLQPEMERIRKKYKDDPQQLNQQVMNLYKKHKVNPVGGCLPMLLQMPVFIALYTVLANSVELRHADFVGWIHDLSAPDTLFRLNGFEFHVLPILMAASMFWQQKLTPTDPRQAALTYIMPLMMLFFFYGFPSGLALYWTVTNLLSVAQQYMINSERERDGQGPEDASGRGSKKQSPAGALAR
jgi:YidC/Oxa1 family membrane protein insertase